MEKLPSKNHEKLLVRIRDAEDCKLSLSSLSEEDLDRLCVLSDRGLIQDSDLYFPKNDPGSSVVFIGPLSKSVTLTTAGKDYLSDLAEERKSSWKRFCRDVLMLIIGAVITLVITYLFNLLTVSVDPVEPVPVAKDRPAIITPTPGLDPIARE